MIFAGRSRWFLSGGWSGGQIVPRMKNIFHIGLTRRDYLLSYFLRAGLLFAAVASVRFSGRTGNAGSCAVCKTGRVADRSVQLASNRRPSVAAALCSGKNPGLSGAGGGARTEKQTTTPRPVKTAHENDMGVGNAGRYSRYHLPSAPLLCPSKLTSHFDLAAGKNGPSR